MRRFIVWTGLALGVVLSLSACTVTVDNPISDRVDGTVTPTTQTSGTITSAPTNRTLTLGSGERRVFQVDAGGMQGFEALYIALDEADARDDEVELRVYRSGGSLYASSATSAFFAPGTRGLSVQQSAESSVGAQAISNAIACPGSCVIAPRLNDATYFSVRNTGGSALTVDVYAVLRDFEDTNEPNDSVSRASSLDGSGVAGALETIDDVDVFVVDEDGEYELIGAESSGIEYRADVYYNGDVEGAADDTFGGPGDTRDLLVGDVIFVYAADQRAAPAGGSSYDIF